MGDEWWRTAVVYQVYLRSFADGNGDGVGDLLGLRSRLSHLVDLGVDALWITPHYPSPMADHGYDVADHRGVDPLFGTLRDLDELVADAHTAGLRVLLDLVPNHTSDQHAWFREALADPASAARRRYHFRDGRGTDGTEPPNSWQSVFGGPAWTRESPEGQWYLHLFAKEQPDLDWSNPEVADDFDGVLRFWLDRGVDGFRVDVAHGLAKHPDLPDNPIAPPGTDPFDEMSRVHTFDQDAVHDIWRRWRALVGTYDGDRVLVGEVFLYDAARLARYVRPDELHLAFNFLLLGQGWDAPGWTWAIEQSTVELAAVGAPASWVLSNHDLPRHVTRYGGGDVGAGRARAALLVALGLPGAAFVYAGEELGLEEVDVPPSARQDPLWRNTAGAHPGRDGCRVPLPWDDSGPACGFSTAPPWLPQPDGWAVKAVAAQAGDPSSMLAFYRRVLRLRRHLTGGWSWLAAPDGVLAIRRGDDTVIAANMSGSTAQVRLPWPGTLAITGRDDCAHVSGRLLWLDVDAGAWARRR
jgi:alpha-glucosidase